MKEKYVVGQGEGMVKGSRGENGKQRRNTGNERGNESSGGG